MCHPLRDQRIIGSERQCLLRRDKYKSSSRAVPTVSRTGGAFARFKIQVFLSTTRRSMRPFEHLLVLVSSIEHGPK